MVISVFWIAPQILQFWLLSLLWVWVLYMSRNKGWVITYCELNCVKGLKTFFGSLWVIEASKKSSKIYLGEPLLLGPMGPNLKWEYLGFKTRYRAQWPHLGGRACFKFVYLTTSKKLARKAILAAH